MNASVVTAPATATRRGVIPRRRRRVAASRPKGDLDYPEKARGPTGLDRIASCWQVALDAEERALTAAADVLPASELASWRHQLVDERNQTAKALVQLARATCVRPPPWLAPVPITAHMLGLPATVNACLFDLDGVLTDSGVLHAWAWAAAFDAFLQHVAQRDGWQFIPFDRETDYLRYLDGRSRLQGVHAFLDSRGLRVPEGRPDDAADAETAYGLAKRKSQALARSLHRQGVTAVPGARRYLEAAGHAGLKRAVVSASARTLPMLELAGLATLVEERIDADLIRVENLRPRPAPDVLLAACSRLDVDPPQAVTFTTSPAGVAAGLAGGLVVVGVGDAARRELLRGFGAGLVAPSLEALLDRRLSASQPRPIAEA